MDVVNAKAAARRIPALLLKLEAYPKAVAYTALQTLARVPERQQIAEDWWLPRMC